MRRFTLSVTVFFCAYCHFESSEPPPICLCVFLSAANREGFFLLMSQFAAVTTVRLTVCSGAKVNFSRWFTLARIPAHYRGKQWLLTARGSKRTSVSMATAADSRRPPCALNMPYTDGAQISRCWLHCDNSSCFDLQEKSWIRSPEYHIIPQTEQQRHPLHAGRMQHYHTAPYILYILFF